MAPSSPRSKPAAAKAAAGAATKRVVDLNAARAARMETEQEPVTILIADAEFTLPVELPADYALLAMGGDLRGAVQALLGDDADRFFETRPSLPDLEALIEGVNGAYGVAEGDSPASASS